MRAQFLLDTSFKPFSLGTELRGRSDLFAIRNFIPRTRRKTKVRTFMIVATRCLSKNDENPVNAIAL